MAIVRCEPFGRNIHPFHNMNTYKQGFERFFDEFLRPDQSEMTPSRWLPAVDVSESGEQYFIHAEIPGLSRDEVKITLENNILTISGEKKLDRELKERDFHLTERSHGQFTRSFTLPSRVDSQAIKANFKDGVLEIELPKAPEAKAREIEIKVN
jgi:HSP20 family protein